MTKLLTRLYTEEDGQDLTEYALLLVMIALVGAALLGSVGNTVNNVFSNTNSQLTR